MRHVHLGLGRFHRAHQAVYFQNLKDGPRVTAFSMRSATEVEALKASGYQYQVLMLSDEGGRRLTVDCIDEAHFALENRARLYQLLADPAVASVTLTVTEKGYCADSQGTIDESCPALQADLDNSFEPTSTLGLLVRGLERRQQAGHGQPINIISCDNLNGNGTLLAKLCCQWCERYGDGAFVDYLQSSVGFPNTMVDRIVPALSPEQLQAFASQYGGDEASLVATEEFTQWVIEDRFLGQRPHWEQEGLIFCQNVESFERIKLSLLNASHSFLAYYGQLQGHQFVHQAIADPKVRELVEQLYFQEVGPLIQAPQGVDLESYCQQLLRRFENPHLAHKLAQIGMDGSQKIPQRILGSLVLALDSGGPHQTLKLALDSWLRYMWLGLSGKADLFISDPLAESMKKTLAGQYETTSQGWLFEHTIFGTEMAQRLKPLYS